MTVAFRSLSSPLKHIFFFLGGGGGTPVQKSYRDCISITRLHESIKSRQGLRFMCSCVCVPVKIRNKTQIYLVKSALAFFIHKEIVPIVHLTFSQTTNFRLFQSERAILNLMKIGIKVSKLVENTVEKGEIACRSVFIRLLQQTRKNQGLFGKGLKQSKRIVSCHDIFHQSSNETLAR